MPHRSVLDRVPSVEPQTNSPLWPVDLPREEYGEALKTLSSSPLRLVDIGELSTTDSQHPVLGSLGFVTCTGVIIRHPNSEYYTVGHLPPSDSSLRGEEIDIAELMERDGRTELTVLMGSRHVLRRDVAQLARNSDISMRKVVFKTGSGRWGFVLDSQRNELVLATDNTTVEEPIQRYTLTDF